MANQEIHDLLRTAIQAAQRGNKAVAKPILQQVLERDPQNELAWLWLASVVESVSERRACLQRVLSINPDNKRARQALDKLAGPTPDTAAGAAPPVSSRLTPRIDRAPAAREVDTLRDETLAPGAVPRKAKPRPGGMSPLMFITVGILSVAIIALALILLVGYLEDEPAATATNTPVPPTRTMLPTQVAQANGFVSPTPVGGVARTVAPEITFAPVWTATNTPEPSATPTATAAPVPLSAYSLVVSGKRGSSEQWALFTINADGTGETGLSFPIPSSSGDVGANLALQRVYNASVSPDGERIAFTARIRDSRLEDGKSVVTEYDEIFVAPISGGSMQQLTTLQASHTEDAVWSHDGRHIAFASDQDGDFEIYILELASGIITQLTDNAAIDRQPTWSPDDLHIAYASDYQSSPNLMQIWRLPIQRPGDNQRLTDSSGSSFSPDWSPAPAFGSAGRSALVDELISFISVRSGDADLYVMYPDGTNERSLLLRDGDAEDLDPAWSSNGEWIAFSSNRDSDDFDLFLIRPDGTDLTQISDAQGATRYAAWRPGPLE